MYGTILSCLIVLAVLGVWHLLKRTRLNLPARIVLAAVLSVLTAAVLVWASICTGILLYQLNDPIGW